MGYTIPRRTILIDFESGHEFHGAEVQCRFDVDFGTFFSYQHLAEAQDSASLEQIIRSFGDEIVQAWNLDDARTGEPIPVSGDSLLRQPYTFTIALLETWLGRMTRIPDPLSQASKNGGTSAGRSTRKGAKSPSR